MGIVAPVVERSAKSADGTEIAYYVIGRGPRAWVVPPAMGAPLVSLKHVFERFQDEYTMLSWDMRGFYHSAAPADPEALRVEDHVADLEAVCRAEGYLAEGRTPFVLGGWSMAVQISLEYAYRHPELVRALVLINGPFERPLQTALPLPRVRRILPSFARAGVRLGLGRGVSAVAKRMLGRPGMGRVLHRAGYIADNPDFFEELLDEFRHIDWDRYLRLVLHLNEHSAASYLSGIRVPTLITAGTRDILTPPSLAARMHREIPGSELWLVEGGTHYTVAEYPERLTEGIARFLARIDQGKSRDSAA